MKRRNVVCIGITGVAVGICCLTMAQVTPPVTAQRVNKCTIRVEGEYRYIDSNGIPDHVPGQFPNRGNPNTIQQVDHHFRVPVKPVIKTNPNVGRGALFGVAINGIPFDPGTAEVWNNDFRFHYEALTGKLGGRLGTDDSQAHVQPDGSYHYHGLPFGLLKRLKYDKKMALVAWAADGYPVYAQYAYKKATDAKTALVKLTSGYKLRSGDRSEGPTGPFDGSFLSDYAYDAKNGDLDENNGRTGVTPEFPKGTYYYVLTDTFPFVPRSLKGVPDASFSRRPPMPGGRNGGIPSGPKDDLRASGKFITIVRGRTVYIYSADGLKLISKKEIPD